MSSDQRRVVITGLGLKTPAGCSPESAFVGLLAGRSTATLMHVDGDRGTSFIACRVRDFASADYFSPREGRRMSRATKLGVAAAVDAVDDAGLTMPPGGDRIGVMVGQAGASMLSGLDELSLIAQKSFADVPPYGVPMIMPNATAAALSIRFGLTGPSMTYSTSCASGANALGEAMVAIRSGAIDVAIAGGVETPLHLGLFHGFHAARALSRRTAEPGAASRPFDSGRDGFVLAEGAAFVVLECLPAARARGARIYAELAGYATNSDASHIVAPRADGTVAARCMRSAIADARLAPAEIGHVNAHGTSTVHNDRSEALALEVCFGADAPAVTAPKGVVGHMLGAAGAFEAVITALSVARGVVPPVANYHRGDEGLDVHVVADRPLRLAPVPALSNSFGFGGHNVSLVVSPL